MEDIQQMFKKWYESDLECLDLLEECIGVYYKVEVVGLETMPNSPFYCDLMNVFKTFGNKHGIIIMIDGKNICVDD